MSDAAVVDATGIFPGAQGKPARKSTVMDEDDVLAIIGRELAEAVGQDGDELSNQRAQALDAYNGKPVGLTDRAGHSTVVMRNVLEAVEWVLPALLRVFVASGQIAVVEATKPGETEAEAAKTATLYIQQIFYRDNDGFSILHDWFKSALLSKVGWTKRYWDTRVTQQTEGYTGLTPVEYQAKMAELQQKGEVEVLESRDYTDPVLGPVHDCTLQVTSEQSRVQIETVPPEEIVFSPRCRRGYMPFVCHRRQRTFSDLLQDGYDEDAIRECLGTGNSLPSDEAVRRQQPIVSSSFEDPLDESMRNVTCEESYLLLDYNQDGIAELCKVMTVNDATRVLLRRDGKPDIAPIDESPLVWLTPVPMPHTLAGSLSLADLVLDLQKIKSTLLRQMLDNIYLTNNPRIIVSDNASNENTQTDILNSQPGGIIRARDAAGIVPHVTPFVANAAFPLLEYVDQTQEARTGVARHNQGLDPDTLTKTATGINLLQGAAAQRVELIARIFGRGVEELVRGILGLVRRHQQQARIVMVTGRPLTMDPKLWREEFDVSVNVGLGTGNKDQLLAHLMTILQLQNGVVQLQGGPNGPLVYNSNVYTALEKLTEQAGFKESFFADPSQPPPQGTPPPQPKPDPEMAKVQGQMQLAMQKTQAQMAVNKAKAEAAVEVSGRQAMQEIAIERDQTNEEVKLKREEMAHRMALEREDAANRFRLEQQKLENELEIERLRVALKERELAMATSREAPEARPAG